jgi:hypothetical protein
MKKITIKCDRCEEKQWKIAANVNDKVKHHIKSDYQHHLFMHHDIEAVEGHRIAQAALFPEVNHIK